MTHPLRLLSRPSLIALADAIRSGRVSPPYSSRVLEPLVPASHRPVVVAYLRTHLEAGGGPAQLAELLEVLAEERAAAQRVADRVQLVWSPPELDEVDARDTSAVVRALFLEAESSLHIVTYALDEQEKAVALFGELAARMDLEPELSVRLYANIHRPYQDDLPPAQRVKAFSRHFRDRIWPGERLPDLFYDPRSLAGDQHKRAVLHAKGVVIDERKVFLTSANFTEAAHDRNMEAGVVIEDPTLAGRVVQQLCRLVEKKALVPVPGV